MIQLERGLERYDPIRKAKLVRGFKFGFDLGFRGKVLSKSKISNLKITKELPHLVQKALDKEIKENRLLGPFTSPPFKEFQINPIGLVPKSTPGSYRMIVDLSSPQGNSINDSIDDIFAKVNYARLEDALSLVLKCGPTPYMAKTDIEKAFRLLPLNPDQYHLVGIFWEGHFYFDKCIPMGARSSCQLFEEFSSAVEFIAKERGVQFMVHYLDDFFLVNVSEVSCHKDLHSLLSTGSDIRVPWVVDKTVLPTRKTTFIGFEIDTVDEVVRLPNEKLLKCRESIEALLTKSSCTLKTLQQLLGLLNFACTVVVPGRAFLQRLYALTVGVKQPYHFVKINTQAKQDLLLWLHFLKNFNGVTLYRTEMFLSPSAVNFYTDAAKSFGYGAVFGNHWFSERWASTWWSEQNITLLELVSIVLALGAWGHIDRNLALIINTDNQAGPGPSSCDQ